MTKEKVAKKRAKPEKRWTGLKQAPPGLKEWIELANMVPAGTFLPDLHPIGVAYSWDEFVAKVNRLPTSLREDLLEHVEDEPPYEDWCRDLKTGELKIRRELWWEIQIDERYDKIRAAYWFLRMVSRSETKSIDPLETLVSILRRADLSYLRQCAYAKCGAVFFAGKSKQQGCIPEHSEKFRKKEKYRKDVERRHPNPKMRAKTASKR